MLRFASSLTRSLVLLKPVVSCWSVGTGGASRLCSCALTINTTTLDKHTMMETASMQPPHSVSGMMQLDRSAFQKKVTVPCVTVQSKVMNTTFKRLKKYLLKLQKLQSVRDAHDDSQRKEILLNPTLVKTFEDIKEHLGEVCDDIEFLHKEITIEYDNWRFEDVLKAVLPPDQSNILSYSRVGHILHLNLREHLLPYKTLIGQVYLDKVPNISMVVNKLNIIDSTYRNFQMEVLAGSGDTVVTVKENGCSYELDFARVYWNPRLSTEHSRVVEKLNHGDVLYDVMAGVGPFAIPAGRKKCHVLANDLNPDSFEALVKNCSRNKVTERVRCFNMDGHDFIQTTLKADLIQRWKDPDFVGSIHIAMNLPAMAVTFLSSFQGLMYGVEEAKKGQLPIVHVYMFTKDTIEDTAIGRVAENLGYSPKEDGVSSDGDSGDKASDVSISDVNIKGDRSYISLKRHIKEVIHVRQVAPNKAMMRVTFELPLEVLIEECHEEPVSKKLKTS